MQSRRPKPLKIGDKKAKSRSTSTPSFKKETEPKDTFSYLRKTNEKVKSAKNGPGSFKNSFGKKSKDVVAKEKNSTSFYSERFGKKSSQDPEIGKDKRFEKSFANKKQAEGEGKKRIRERIITTPKQITPDKGNKKQTPDETVGIRLNRFIANAGVCARREADKLIEAGEIYVNGKVVTDFSFRVQPTDTVKYGSKTLKREKPVYVLLNKPKNFLTTTEDPEGRPSVMDLVKEASPSRLYPVGRLDRNTTGLLLLTNDGDLAEKLMHPSYKAKKIYQVDLDRPFEDTDLFKVRNGIQLEDGPIKADDIEIVSPDRKSVGIEIHSGRNRIVRRIFEHLGYTVERLDRVMYAGLTKKDLPRGTWRHLTEMEITNIKHLKK